MKSLILFTCFLYASHSFAGKTLVLTDEKNRNYKNLLKYLTDNNVEIAEAEIRTWDNTAPKLEDNFSAVILFCGYYCQIKKLPARTQKALTNFVKEGGIFIGSGYLHDEYKAGNIPYLSDLVLFGATVNAQGYDHLLAETISKSPLGLYLPQKLYEVLEYEGELRTFENGNAAKPLYVNAHTQKPVVAYRYLRKGLVINLGHTDPGSNGSLADHHIRLLYLNGVRQIIDGSTRPDHCKVFVRTYFPTKEIKIGEKIDAEFTFSAKCKKPEVVQIKIWTVSPDGKESAIINTPFLVKIKNETSFTINETFTPKLKGHYSVGTAVLEKTRGKVMASEEISLKAR